MTEYVAIHLVAVIPALFLGVLVLATGKGTARHKLLGRIWVGLMVVTAISSFGIADLNPDGSLSWIHILSTITLVTLAIAIWAIRRGNRRLHAGCMIANFTGVVGAGGGALDPNRIVGGFLFG